MILFVVLLRWRVNGTDVVIGEDTRYTLVAGNLVINNPQHGHDAGSYQCLAINRCGIIVSRAANLKFGCKFGSDLRSLTAHYVRFNYVKAPPFPSSIRSHNRHQVPVA